MRRGVNKIAPMRITGEREKGRKMKDKRKKKRLDGDQLFVAAVRRAWVVMFSVLLDKHGARADELKQLWDEVEDLSKSIKAGYVSEADLRRVLREEYGITIGEK